MESVSTIPATDTSTEFNQESLDVAIVDTNLKPSFASTLANILNDRVSSSHAPLSQGSLILSQCRRIQSSADKLRKQTARLKQSKDQLRRKRALMNRDHKTLLSVELEYERKLKKLATKGVVQLFNAITTQQKLIQPAEFTTTQSQKGASLLISNPTHLQWNSCQRPTFWNC